MFLLPKYSDDDFNTCLNLESVLFKEILFEWRRNYGSRRKPDYRPLCTFTRRFIRGKLYSNFDLHYVNPSASDNGSVDVGFYVTKYMLKPSDRAEKLQQALRLNLDEALYDKVWSLVRPRCFNSLGLGVNGELTPFGVEPDPKIVDYVKECVSLSKNGEKSPKFFNPESGASFPLSRYYRSKFYCYTQADFEHFAQFNEPDNIVYDDKDISQKILSESRFINSVNLADLHDGSEDLNFIFDE